MTVITINRLHRCWPILAWLCLAACAYPSSYDISYFSGPLGFRLLDSAGMNNNGGITGWGFNDTGGPDGLLRSSNGVISTFGSPGSFTQANAINDKGQIVGDYYDATGIHAFLRQPDGTLQTLQLPYDLFGFSAPHFESAKATGINDNGQIIGTFTAIQSNGNVFNGSFLEQPDGTFIAIDPTNDTYLTSISNNGYILGTDAVNGVLTPFVMDSSLQIIRTLTDVPVAYGYGAANLTSINSSGDIIGSYDSTYGAFLTNVFTGEYTNLPSPKYCTAGAINDAGVITGTCQSYQAFVLTPTASPVPEPPSICVTLWALTLGVAAMRKLRLRRAE